ncbi:MAG: 16S rRNA processing protein RimM, partial [Bacteroidaceae bacterium]|nr:16S rRNA processing protein RimM [Bacteroidaceae bacterium]
GEEVFQIGHISKFRGLAGEVEIVFTDDCFDRGDSEFIVFKLDGIYVPFFWEEYRFKNDSTAIFKFEGIDTDNAARKFVGTQVFYPHCHIDAESAELTSYKAFTGYQVYTSQGKLLGSISAVDDSSANILLYIDTPSGKELLLPLHEDFVTAYDLKERTLHLELPEGLLEINE